MPRVIPAPLHRAALRIVHALRTRWWRMHRPRIVGCRVLALNRAGRVLLIRHSYGSGDWMAPGGGIGRNEDPVAAAMRELREETACVLRRAREVAAVVENLHGASNEVHIVVGHVAGMAQADGREVIEARFFPLDALPRSLAGTLREEIPAWVNLYEDHSNDS
jgi:8-oxo-dGTP pyrophosphatase MutT (NUDIX family)